MMTATSPQPRKRRRVAMKQIQGQSLLHQHFRLTKKASAAKSRPRPTELTEYMPASSPAKTKKALGGSSFWHLPEQGHRQAENDTHGSAASSAAGQQAATMPASERIQGYHNLESNSSKNIQLAGVPRSDDGDRYVAGKWSAGGHADPVVQGTNKIPPSLKRRPFADLVRRKATLKQPPRATSMDNDDSGDDVVYLGTKEDVVANVVVPSWTSRQFQIKPSPAYLKCEHYTSSDEKECHYAQVERACAPLDSEHYTSSGDEGYHFDRGPTTKRRRISSPPLPNTKHAPTASRLLSVPIAAGKSLQAQNDIKLHSTMSSWRGCTVPSATALLPFAGPVAGSASGDESLGGSNDRLGITREEPRCYTLQEFVELWEHAELDISIDRHEADHGKLVREGNRKGAQYGRIYFPAFDKILREILCVQQSDLYLDIGHGVGNTVLQAAYTTGCDARGIEYDKDRNALSIAFAGSIAGERTLLHTMRDERKMIVGTVDLCFGSLDDEQHLAFLVDGDRPMKVFFNNFNGVFGHRHGNTSKETFTLDGVVAGLFAMMLPGSILVSLDPLVMGCLPRSRAREARSAGRQKLAESLDDSFYEVQVVPLEKGRDLASWFGANEEVHNAYVYTRLKQTAPAAMPVFLCNMPRCTMAIECVPLPLIRKQKIANGETRRLIHAQCSCGYAPAVLRPRGKKVVDYAE